MKRKSTDLSTTIVSWTRRLSFSILLAGCFASPSWSQVKQAEIVGNPSTNEDRVTVRVKVKDADDKPIMGLQDTNFGLIVDNQPLQFKTKDWKSAEDTVPPPAWVVVLIDYSGSMKQQDSRGTTKQAGAINAIREVIKAFNARAPQTKISIVPFGEAGLDCKGFSVTPEKLDNFYEVRDFKLLNYLEYLEKQEVPCASTNIYEPLSATIKFLGNTGDKRFFVPEDSKEPQPRLSVILLSDGYHNKPNETQDFQRLISLLKSNEQIIVHTLGYGLTPEQLGQKYGLNRAATRADIGKGNGKVPEEQFVDRERLAEIAKTTGGIAEFSGDANAIAENLKLFLNALLGEYEISYIEPNAERGSKHDVRVVVKPTDGAEVTSTPKSYAIAVFGRSLPLDIRLMMLGGVLVTLILGGVLPFWLWAQHLKREAEET